MNRKKEERIKFYKDEFIKRYVYLYQNAECILAPYMYEEPEEELNDRLGMLEVSRVQYAIDNPLIYRKSIDRETLLEIEEFLFSEDKMEESIFYKKFEHLKNSMNYGSLVKEGKALVEKKNQFKYNDEDKFNLDVLNLLKDVKAFIFKQSNDIKNRNMKLDILKEYCGMYRYTNNGKRWASVMDISKGEFWNYDNFIVSLNNFLYKPDRSRDDVGVMSNGFIKFFGNTSLRKNKDNGYHFSEKEKQAIYVSLHEELPWDLVVLCKDDEGCNSFIIPEFSKPYLSNLNSCGSEIYIKEEEIFIGKVVSEDKEYISLYHSCPKCNNIVRLPDSLIPEKIRERIIDRCEKEMKSNEKYKLLVKK